MRWTFLDLYKSRYIQHNGYLLKPTASLKNTAASKMGIHKKSFFGGLAYAS